MSVYRVTYDDDDACEIVTAFVEANDPATAIFRAGADWARLGIRLNRTAPLASATVVRLEEPTGWREVELP